MGESSNYLFSVYDRSGNLKRKFGREYKPIPLTNEEKDKMTDHPTGKQLRQFLPDTKPAFKISYFRFLVDDKNNFWVHTFEREQEGITYDIFDQDGVYIRKAFINFTARQLSPLLVKNDFLYAIHRDKDGLNTVKKYKIGFEQR